MEQFNIPEELKAKIEAAETLEEVAKLCTEAGYEVTVEELEAAVNAPGDELSEGDLDNVAGGCFICDIIREIKNYLKKLKDRMIK